MLGLTIYRCVTRFYADLASSGAGVANTSEIAQRFIPGSSLRHRGRMAKWPEERGRGLALLATQPVIQFPSMRARGEDAPSI